MGAIAKVSKESLLMLIAIPAYRAQALKMAFALLFPPPFSGRHQAPVN
jgi:hypothetical protein